MSKNNIVKSNELDLNTKGLDKPQGGSSGANTSVVPPPAPKPKN